MNECECVKKNTLLVDCVMGAWGSWTSCGTSCSSRDGTGARVRTRSPNIYAAHGGADCTEYTQEERACTVDCPGNLVFFKQFLVSTIQWSTNSLYK